MDNRFEIVPENGRYMQNEHEEINTPYETESSFYIALSRGDIKTVKNLFGDIFHNTLIVGKMSEDPVRQVKYFAACSIAVAIRYAIAGGLEQSTAYKFSSDFILFADKLENENEIAEYLISRLEVLCEMVFEARNHPHSPAVAHCLKYISANLHKTLRLDTIACECSLSKDYLTLIFKKEMGMTIPVYIRKERLKEARELAETGMTVPQIAYTVGFNSESHFIKCYREEFGITPGKSRNPYIRKGKFTREF